MGVNNLTYSGKGLALTEQYEGCRLTAYQDQVDVWTIGYGHTGADVTPGLTITLQQAETLLAKDVLAAARCVNNMVKLHLPSASSTLWSTSSSTLGLATLPGRLS